MSRTTEGSWFDWGRNISVPRSVLGLTHPHIQWVQLIVFPGRGGCRVVPPSSAEFKNSWNRTPTSPSVFVLWCLTRYRDRYTWWKSTAPGSPRGLGLANRVFFFSGTPRLLGDCCSVLLERRALFPQIGIDTRFVRCCVQSATHLSPQCATDGSWALSCHGNSKYMLSSIRDCLSFPNIPYGDRQI